MSDDIRVGDRFLVEVELVERSQAVGLDHKAVVVGFEGNRPQSYTTGELLAAKRLPRAIKVGDKVRIHPDSVQDYRNEGWGDDDLSATWTVLALDSFDPPGAALVRSFGATMFRRDWAEVADLTHADEATP